MAETAREEASGTAPSLKVRTARTLKWNGIDRISTQVLYAVTGVVLANVLSKDDFGLVGVLLVFQAFATIFVDSGFGAALLQKKHPLERDYSTVFWFNTCMCVFIYLILYFSAPLIARAFHNDMRLIPLSRVMFLSFILNGLGIVQTNRLMKMMQVKQIALANIAGLTLSGIAGVWLALAGYGPWALVWQTIVLAAIKTSWLWLTGGWLPRYGMSASSLRSVYRVGASVFATSLLNTIFLNVYHFVIGIWYSFASLGDYTQADKWSKMGSASLSQILTSTFVPLLSRFQDDRERYREMMGKVNRLTAFMLFPFMGGLVVMAEPLFHTLFGTKWDSAIPLFQLLAARGIFTVLCSLYGNYLLSLGYARSLVVIEVVKDCAIIAAIGATVFLHSVEALVWGQLAAGVLTWLFVLWLTSRATGFPAGSLFGGLVPYLLLTLACMALCHMLGLVVPYAPLLLAMQCVVGLGVYLAILRLCGDSILREALGFLLKKTK